jgi:hypothetical protein
MGLIDDMDDGAKLVQRGQGAAALEAFFQFDQKEHRRPGKERKIHGGVDALY